MASELVIERGPFSTNPFLDPVFAQDVIEQEHRRLGIDCSYGGWLENRRELLRGSYLEEKQAFLHLGIDFNVPAGAKVAAKGKVVLIDSDYPDEGGWGTRVILQLDDVRLIYAHLAQNVKVKVGDRLVAGGVIGEVGKPPYNGNWFSHLHVQVVRNDLFKEFQKEGLHLLDGYGAERDRYILAKHFPDPMQYVRLV